MARKRKALTGQFAHIYDALTDSVVWRLLSPHERALWPEVLRQWRKQTRMDATFPFTFPQRHPLYAHNTMNRAFRTYCDLGMLEVDTPGGLLGQATKYLMSEKWRTWSPAQIKDKKRRKAYIEAMKRDKNRHAAYRHAITKARERRARVITAWRQKPSPRRGRSASPPNGRRAEPRVQHMDVEDTK